MRAASAPGEIYVTYKNTSDYAYIINDKENDFRILVRDEECRSGCVMDMNNLKFEIYSHTVRITRTRGPDTTLQKQRHPKRKDQKMTYTISYIGGDGWQLLHGVMLKNGTFHMTSRSPDRFSRSYDDDCGP